MNSDPLAEALGIHDGFPDLLRSSGNVGADADRTHLAASGSTGLPIAQRALDSGVERVQWHAEQLGGVVVGW